MRRSLFLSILISICTLSNAQGNLCAPNEVFTIAEKMPKLLSSPQQIKASINEKMILKPKDKGKVFVRCTIDCNGKLIHAEIQRAEVYISTARLLALIQLECAFQAALQRGEPVNCYFSLGFSFKKGKCVDIIY